MLYIIHDGYGRSNLSTYTLQLLLLNISKHTQFGTNISILHTGVIVSQNKICAYKMHEKHYMYMYLPRCKEFNKNKVLAV